MQKLIYGTAWKKERTTALVKQAILCGFRGIDTACQPRHYREDLVGDALFLLYDMGIKREELFLQTKFTPVGGQDKASIPYDPNQTVDKQIIESFEVTKKNLKSDYVDSYLLHSPIFPYTNLLSAWQTMESLHDKKEAKRLGISNCYELSLLQKLYADARVKPSVVQNRFYAESGYDKELRRWCDEHSITYQSFWSLTANPHILASDTLLALAGKYDKTAAQVFYRYLNHIGIVPLIGSTSKLHIEQDLQIFEFELLSQEIDSVTVLLD